MIEITHQWPVRVYYEDTDLGGIVYYANYLKFIERARSEWLRSLDIDQQALKDTGYVFAVRHLDADYHSPAFYDDLLTVDTRLLSQTTARQVIEQRVSRSDKLLFSAKVTIVCLGPSLRPARIPAALRDAISPHEPSNKGI